VIDRNGTILARHPDPEKWIGKFLPEAPLIEAILARGEGTVEVSGVDGFTRLFAFMPVQGTHNSIHVSIGISREAAFAAAGALFVRSLVVLVLMGLLTLWAAWALSDLVILRRVNALARAAERLSDGDLGARADVRGEDEIGMMARGFNAMAEGLAGMIMAEEHARKALAEHARESDLLNRMVELLHACPTPEDAYTVLRGSIEQFFPDQAGAVLVIGPSRNLMEAKVEWGASGVGEKGAFAPEACWALRRGQAHVVEDSGSGLLCKHLAVPAPAAYLCIPLLAQGDALGILHVNSPPGRAGPDAGLPEGKRRLAITVAEQIALALANLRLRETLLSQSIRDPLTGLFNRRYMVETLERELHWAQRRRRPVGVIVLDIDRFKPFNDTHGHDAGDAVLRELGGLLNTNSRGGDIACRFGGEEFVLILPEADLEDTRRRAEQLREAARTLRVSHRGKVLKPFTLSLGVAAFPKHGETGEALLKAADEACYRAKREGRNRVAVGE
jgi:diguanylate cyclase (GGDEF)-like protein